IRKPSARMLYRNQKEYCRRNDQTSSDKNIQTINKQMDSLDLLHYGWYVGIKIHYRLSTNSYIINILSYTVLEDDANDEK
ncbi:hypothetical protein NE548_09315, partial [Lactobacillus gasseri]|nr:hypothetical protein [Lactobacillus gasseri]